MKTPYYVPAALCLAAGFAAPVARADSTAPTPAGTESGHDWGGDHHWHGGHRHHRGHQWRTGHHRGAAEFRHVMRQLNLTTEQHAKIKSIVTESRKQMQASRVSARSNHETLLATTPNSPQYAALLQTEKTNALARIQAASDRQKQIYAVLTPAQQAQIPTILAADHSAREARKAAWDGHHGGS